MAGKPIGAPLVSFQTRHGIPLRPDYAAAQRATRDAALMSPTRAACAPAQRIDEAERARRREFVDDSMGAVLANETFEQRTKRREKVADDWAQWFRRKMSEGGYRDPVQSLPDAFARLEFMMQDKINSAVADLKKSLLETLK
jgi:hypothetical protein